MAQDLDISYGSVQTIMHDVLEMRRVSERLVLRVLNYFQKEHRNSVAEEMIAMSDIIVQRIIAGDAKVAPKSRQCWLFSLIFKVLCTRSSFQPDKQLTLHAHKTQME